MKSLRLFLLGLALLVPSFVRAEEVFVETAGYYLDLPDGWELLDAKDLAKLSFTDKAHVAVFQVLTVPAAKNQALEGLARQVLAGLKAQGEVGTFTYQGEPAAAAEISFRAGRYDVQGYALFVQGGANDYALLAFAPVASYAAYFPELLSCIDSFAPDKAARLFPGPLSQLFAAFPSPKPKPRTLAFGKRNVTFPAGDEEIEANQIVIEREAKILAAGKGDFEAAWRRHYRAIYRDAYQRLAPLADRLGEAFKAEGTAREKIPASLLAWLQTFAYVRTATLSDFQSPLACVLSRSGDCDSLGMVYVLLLRRLGFDAVLLVSSKYSHAMAGVDVPGKGARIAYEGKNYLVAELTDKVELGLIDQTMADPAGWIPVAFERPVTK